MPMIPLAEGLSLYCATDDYLWPWQAATPVLMMHGFARNARFWQRWIPPIAESRRIYRPDLLGCGESDVPPADYQFTPEAIGGQVIAALDALQLDRVHWVGESSGGIIGLLLAAAHPERIASLVLCNTPGRISDEIRRIYALDRETASAAMRAYGVGEWCCRTLGYRLDVEHADPRLCEWVIAEMDRTPPAVAAALHHCFESGRCAAIAVGDRGAGAAAVGRPEPHRVRTAACFYGEPAARPARTVRRLRPRG